MPFAFSFDLILDTLFQVCELKQKEPQVERTCGSADLGEAYDLVWNVG
jgi:hypothetical protein